MRATLAIGLGGLALGVGTLLVVRARPAASLTGSSAVGGVVLLSVGWGLFMIGLAVGRRVPTPRGAPLLLLAGAAWFLPEWNTPGIGSSLVFTAGLVFYALCPAVVGHAALAYPSGRLVSRAEWVAVVIAYA